MPATIEVFGLQAFCDSHGESLGLNPDYAPYRVCPDCGGTGTDFDQAIEFAADDMDEWYGDDTYEREQFVRDYRGGAYSIPCPVCNGSRVVPTEDYARIVEEVDQRNAERAELAMESYYNRYC